MFIELDNTKIEFKRGNAIWLRRNENDHPVGIELIDGEIRILIWHVDKYEVTTLRTGD
tara:strand:+ start:326 stop:499 length:174 start_codon:yes stop_codon:yes gene_type:complete